MKFGTSFEKENERRVDHKMPHPNVAVPSQKWSEDQTLHIATAYSNPCRWRTRRELMDNYRRHIAASPNVKLYVGELAYGDRPFEVTDYDNPLDFQMRTSHELWHKENLLNAIIQRFPADWQYGAYIDGDFHFTRHDWALEAVHQLQHYDWVQLFSTYSDLSHDHRPTSTVNSFAFNYHNGKLTPIQSRQYGGMRAGATGGGWAFRRSALNVVGGLLDTCILGSSDWYMTFGLAGIPDDHPETQECGRDYTRAIRVWQDRAARLTGNFGYIDCHAIHSFHGTKKLRGYGTRWQILRDHDFNPFTDLSRDSQGIYQLTPEKPGLRDSIRKYFRSRSEDDISE